jgi:hypothetical protein
VEQVAVVENPNEGDADWYIETPISFGLQPAIIVKRGATRLSQEFSRGSVEDALIALPAGTAIKGILSSQQLGCFLALARTEYRPELKKNEISIPAVVSTGQSRTPVVMIRGRTMNNPRWKEHVAIIANWTGSDMRRRNRRERLAEHYKHLGKTVPQNEKQLETEWQQFRGKCRWLGLVKPQNPTPAGLL